MALLPPQERERRLRIIEAGVESEFWKVLKDSLGTYCTIKKQEVIDLHGEGKTQEAERLATEIRAVQRVLSEPSTIIHANKPIFDKYILEPCKACGHVLKKWRQNLSGNTNHGGK